MVVKPQLLTLYKWEQTLQKICYDFVQAYKLYELRVVKTATPFRIQVRGNSINNPFRFCASLQNFHTRIKSIFSSATVWRQKNLDNKIPRRRDTKRRSTAKIVQEEQKRNQAWNTSLSQTRFSDRNCTVVGQTKIIIAIPSVSQRYAFKD